MCGTGKSRHCVIAAATTYRTKRAEELPLDGARSASARAFVFKIKEKITENGRNVN